MTTWKAGEDIKNPNCDITLDDGFTTVGLMLADRNGRRSPTAIKRSPYPRQSTKISQTNNKYSDMEPPYYSIMQDSWIGGRAGLNFEDDTTRYMDNYRAWTDLDKQICNGPQEVYSNKYKTATTYYKQVYQSIPGSVNFTSLTGNNLYLAHKFQPAASMTVLKISAIIKRVGTPTGSLVFAIYNNSGGSPSTLNVSGVVTVAEIEDGVSEMREVSMSSITPVLGISTDFWVVVYQESGTATTTNHWEVGTNPSAATDTKNSKNGTTWGTATYELYYRVMDDVDLNLRFFEYKRAIYAVDMQSPSHSYIFLNGDRGAADDNASYKTKLIDASKTDEAAWTTNEWKDCIVLITKGPGSADTQPWRLISSNTATELTVTEAWVTTHTTSTEYVILGSNKWTYKDYISSYNVTDIAVSDEIVYFASGDTNLVQRYNEKNTSTGWTKTLAPEVSAKATRLRAINTPDGWELWGSMDSHSKLGSCIWHAKIPLIFSDTSDLYNLVKVLDDGKGVWDEQSVTNVVLDKWNDGTTMTVDAAFTTGTIASKAIPPTDITQGTAIGMLVKSTETTTATDIDLKLDDTPFLGRSYTPDKVWHYDTEVLPNDVLQQRAFSRPTSVYFYDASGSKTQGVRKGAPSSVKYFDASAVKDDSADPAEANDYTHAYFTINNASDYETTYKFNIPAHAIADYIYVSAEQRFSSLYIDMGTIVNTVDSDMTAEIWTGTAWADIAIPVNGDGTKTGAKSLNKSGEVTFTVPSVWEKGCDYHNLSYLATDLYHMRIKESAIMTPNIAIARMTITGYVEPDTTEHWFPVGNLTDNETSYDFKVNWKGLRERDYLYVSFAERMSGVYFDIPITGTHNDVTNATLTAEYWTGDKWSSVSITDGTIDGTYQTMGQSGLVRWTTPSDWSMGSANAEAPYLAADRYHIRFKVDQDLTANVQISKITVHGDGNGEKPDESQFVNLKNTYDANYSSYYNATVLYNKDALYIRYSKRFNRIEFDLDALNNNASTMVGYYWNGSSWVDASIIDGTRPVSATLGTHEGAVTFTMPGNWQAGCPTYLASYLSATDYVIKLQIVTDVSIVATPYLDSVTINKITLEDSSSKDIFNWEEMNNVKDGDTNTYNYLNLTEDDYVYVMFGSKFNKVYWMLDTFNAEMGTTMAAQYFNGHTWTSLSISDGTKFGDFGYTLQLTGYAMSFTVPHDWQVVAIGEESGYAVRFYPSADLTEGIKVTELYVRNDDAMTVSLPALTANTWTYCEMSIEPTSTPGVDCSKIVSIGISLGTPNALGTFILQIASVDLIADEQEFIKLGNSRINSIEAYGDERENPWVFTESQVYEVQTQNENAVVPIPLREITALRSERNGTAHTVSNVYLVFNLGEYIQKYYQHNLDDIGPNRDEGLPINRQGDPTCLLSYPGKIFLSIDASTTGYSTVLLKGDSGWHEVYRAPYGAPIHDMIIQVIPSMSTRLWVSQESDILYLPLPTDTWSPKQDSNYRYTHESVLTTGWINVGFMDILKFWKSVKLYTENLSGTSQYVECEYQTEDGELDHIGDWTDISDTFDTSPFQEVMISDQYEITARRIRFRFKLITTSNTESPIIKSSVIDALMRFPVKYAYNCVIMLADHKENYFGKDNSFRVEMDMDQLEEWSDQPTVLTMRCNYTPYDNKKVVLEPLNSNPIPPFSTNEQLEKHLATITLLEV